MKYVMAAFSLLSLWIVLLLILSLEQVYGLPILFLCLSVLWLEKRNPWWQLLLSVLLAVALATTYTFAFSLGFIIVIGCTLAFHYFRTRLASQTGALLVSSVIAALICGWLSGLQWSWPVLVSLLVSLGASIFMSKITLTNHAKRVHL